MDVSHYDESDASQANQKKLQKLKSLRENVNWKSAEEQNEILRQLEPLISDWKSQLPNLQRIFRPEEIDTLLSQSIRSTNDNVIKPEVLIDFVISTGYHHVPTDDDHGKPVVRSRNTPVHYAARHENCYDLVPKLFKIYDRCDVNYIDKSGLTLFHLACRFNLTLVVEKFLERGHDPNFPWRTTGDSTLNLVTGRKENAQRLLRKGNDLNLPHNARRYSRQSICNRAENKFTRHLRIVNKKTAETLLRLDADPNLANNDGWTALHLICMDHDDDGLLEVLFKICSEKNRPVQIDAQDKRGNTPLHLALIWGNKKVVELLLRKGANPNLADVAGFTPLHVICKRCCDHNDLAELFFKINDEIDQSVQVNAQDNLGQTPLLMAMSRGRRNLIKLLLINGADPNLADDKKVTPLHASSMALGDDSHLAKMLFELGKDQYQPVQVNARDASGQTALHAALTHGHRNLVQCLVRNGADPNLASDVDKSTPLHMICKNKNDHYELVEMLFELTHDKFRPVQVDARDKWGNTPLLLALKYGYKNVILLLLRNGADANVANDEGVTPLYIFCDRYRYNDDLERTFFKIDQDIDSQNKTPLLVVRKQEYHRIAKSLLAYGADPNLVDVEGFTLLHVFCFDPQYHHLVEVFLTIGRDHHKTIHLNARDNLGNTPLHLALLSMLKGFRNVAQVLLERGADPNLANEEGLTPLHIICKRVVQPLYIIENFVELFIKMCEEKNQTLYVDAQDKLGRTPLQLAVAYLEPDLVNNLLDSGADLSKFIFPNESYFGERFEPYKERFAIVLTSSAMAVVESLEKRGYKLNRSDAMTVVKLFAKRGVFRGPADLKKTWYEDEEFESKSKKLMIRPSFSLYDLIQLRPGEDEKLPTHMDYYNFWRSNSLKKLIKSQRKASFALLCEIMSRGFLRRWALDAFLDLTHNRLPYKCCKIIIEHLINKDLCNICFAAIDENSYDENLQYFITTGVI